MTPVPDRPDLLVFAFKPPRASVCSRRVTERRSSGFDYATSSLRPCYCFDYTSIVRLLRRHELVANAVDGSEINRERGIPFELPPQLRYAIVHGSVSATSSFGPNSTYQLRPRDNTPRCLREKLENLEF